MLPRVRAFVIHLVASALLLLGFWFILRRWYPDDLLWLQGAGTILGLLVLVDLVVGPLLTLLVFKPGKKTLLLDMTVIVVLQLSAFAYGAWALSTQRPAYLAFLHDRFFVVTEQDLTAAVSEDILRLESWRGGPRLVSVKMNMLEAMNMQQAIKLAFEPPALALMPMLYRPVGDAKEQLARYAPAAQQGIVEVPVVARAAKGVARVNLADFTILSVRKVEE
jgi:hypothetical protein